MNPSDAEEFLLHEIGRQRAEMFAAVAAYEARDSVLRDRLNQLESDGHTCQEERDRLLLALDEERTALHRVETDNDALSRAVTDREAAIQVLLNSRSWRITRPIRAAAAWLRRFRI